MSESKVINTNHDGQCLCLSILRVTRHVTLNSWPSTTVTRKDPYVQFRLEEIKCCFHYSCEAFLIVNVNTINVTSYILFFLFPIRRESFLFTFVMC